MYQVNNKMEIGTSTVKIELNNDKDSCGSGVLLKTTRNNKPFYFMMTNEHVIKFEMIEKKEKITIINSKFKDKEIELNNEERIIISFKESLNIDVTIVEIIPKDKIDEYFFTMPNINFEDNKKLLKGKEIEIFHYPKREDLHHSKGKIIGLSKKDDCVFYHNLATKPGSSGSPIFLKGDNQILGIHCAALNDNEKKGKKGVFIKIIIDIIKDYQKNGKGKEYYENGELKYDGFFLNDEYDGEGTFYNQNGLIYIGQFKAGKKNGYGCVFKKTNSGNGMLYEGKFVNNKVVDIINNENEDSDNISNNNQNIINYSDNINITTNYNFSNNNSNITVNNLYINNKRVDNYQNDESSQNMENPFNNFDGIFRDINNKRNLNQIINDIKQKKEKNNGYHYHYNLLDDNSSDNDKKTDKCLIY